MSPGPGNANSATKQWQQSQVARPTWRSILKTNTLAFTMNFDRLVNLPFQTYYWCYCGRCPELMLAAAIKRLKACSSITLMDSMGRLAYGEAGDFPGGPHFPRSPLLMDSVSIPSLHKCWWLKSVIFSLKVPEWSREKSTCNQTATHRPYHLCLTNNENTMPSHQKLRK